MNEEIIIQEIKRYSKRFIEQMGGFYPFAIGMNESDEIFLIGAYDGNEFPMSQELMYFLVLFQKSNMDFSTLHQLVVGQNHYTRLELRTKY